MPYKRETASKGGHSDLIRNPDVTAFLNDCQFMRQPSDDEAKSIAATYQTAPTSGTLPERVIASDASPYSDPVDNRFPSTQVGYVKASVMLIDVNRFNGIQLPNSRFVDPYKVAELQRNAESFSFALPGSNVCYKGAKSVQDGFRRALWDQLSDSRTRLTQDNSFTVRGTLLELGGGQVGLRLCPTCKAPHPNGPSHDLFTFKNGAEVQNCPSCGAEVYLTDTLRIHEQVTDYGDCTSAITRFMNATEQLLIATFVRMMAQYQPAALSKTTFILDGPLAVFGQPASISYSLVSFYQAVATNLAARGHKPPIVIGLQKDGQVMEHARAIARFLPPNSYRVVDDAYRNAYIAPVNNDNFGTETYFGQDFIFKTAKGGIFCVGLPYPLPQKKGTKAFATAKVDPVHYGDRVARAFDVVRHFETELYENAVIPVALAHRHASISLTPGGKVLDLLTRNGLGW